MKLLEIFMAYMEGRAKARLYGIFTFWMAVLHANIIFAWLFVDQDLIYRQTGQLKNEYITSLYFHVGGLNFWLVEATKILCAVFFTWLMIWVLPKSLVAKAYDRELTDDYRRKGKKIQKDIELEKKRQDLSSEKIETVKKEERVIEKQENLENKEVREWSREYKALPLARLNTVLDDVTRAVYEHNGHIKHYYVPGEGNHNPNVEKDSVAIAHSSGLVELDSENEIITLTPKGKYFVSRRYSGR